MVRQVRIAHGYSGRSRIAAARLGKTPSNPPAMAFDRNGNVRFIACPIVPVIAPSWKIVESIMISHHHANQWAPSLRPGSSSMAPSVGLPDEIA